MKRSSILGLIVIAIAISVIIAVMSKSSSYSTFNDAKKSESELNVVGFLNKQKELYYDAAKDANYFSFFVKDNKGDLGFITVFGLPYAMETVAYRTATGKYSPVFRIDGGYVILKKTAERPAAGGHSRRAGLVDEYTNGSQNDDHC